MKKAVQLLSIGLAVYNLYLMVDDFLETPTGQKVKDKALEYTEKGFEKAKEILNDSIENGINLNNLAKEESK